MKRLPMIPLIILLIVGPEDCPAHLAGLAEDAGGL